MDKIATFVRNITEGFRGEARLYRVEPPIEYGYGEDRQSTSYVIVSAIPFAFDTDRPETYIFPASEGGNIIDWGELDGSYQGGMDMEKAIRDAGYNIAS